MHPQNGPCSDGQTTLCGEDYLLLNFLLLNLSDYSWRCEKQFRTKNGIIKVWKSPRNTSVVEFRSIFIVLARRVRQLFELVAWWPLNPSSLATVEKNHFDHHSYIRLPLRNFSNLFMILVECLVNCFNTHLIILSSVFRQLTFFTWRQVNFVNHLKTLTDHPIYGKYVNCLKTSHPILSHSTGRKYVNLNLIKFLKTSNLIHPIPFRSYVNFDNCWNASHFIILFIYLQRVSELGHVKYFSSNIPYHPP